MSVVINGDTGISGVNGSAATPAIQGGDNNTGVFFGTDTASISTAGTERVLVNSSGDVNFDNGAVFVQADGRLGVNNTSPSVALDVQTATGTAAILRSSRTFDQTPSVDLGFQYKFNSSNTYTGGAAIQFKKFNATDGHYQSEVRILGRNNGEANSHVVATFGGGADGGFSVGSEAVGLNFSGFGHEDFSGLQYYNAEQHSYATINHAGANGCLYLALTASATSLRFIQFSHQGTSTGGISRSGVGTAYTSVSDYRLKDNIKEYSGGLAAVNKLRPVYFDWVNDPTKNNLGFIAHEVQEVVPQAVIGDKDAVNDDGSVKAQTLEKAALIPVLVASIQELAQKVSELESKLQS